MAPGHLGAEQHRHPRRVLQRANRGSTATATTTARMARSMTPSITTTTPMDIIPTTMMNRSITSIPRSVTNYTNDDECCWGQQHRGELVLQSQYGLLHYTYLTRRTSHFFMPTIFVVHLMLDSYGQPHFLIDTIPCPLPLFYLWLLPYYEYGSIPCSLIRTFPCTYMYINPCT